VHAETGRFFERYNVVDADGPTSGRYPPQRGFGWTNSVYLALVVRILFDREGRPSRQLPASWKDAGLSPSD